MLANREPARADDATLLTPPPKDVTDSPPKVLLTPPKGLHRSSEIAEHFASFGQIVAL